MFSVSDNLFERTDRLKHFNPSSCPKCGNDLLQKATVRDGRIVNSGIWICSNGFCGFRIETASTEISLSPLEF